MVVDFPIRFDFQNSIFGAMLASAPYRPQFAALFVEMFGAAGSLNPRDPHAALNLQENCYHRTVDQLRQVRRTVGHPAGGDDLYSLPWFLLSFHGWMVSAGLRGIEKQGWVRNNDDLSILQRSLLELGVDCTVNQLEARLSTLADSAARSSDLKSVDFDNYAFVEQARYLSAAAIRTGHRVGLEVPAQAVFISHSRSDRDYVNGLVSFLEAHAVRARFDTSDLKSGSKLDERLRQEIIKSECIVIVLIWDSVTRDYVALEVASAIESGKDVLPMSFVPLEELKGMRSVGGRDLYAEIMQYPVVDVSSSSPIEAYEDVLRSLQRTGPDLTRWKQDEGSHLSVFREMLAGR